MSAGTAVDQGRLLGISRRWWVVATLTPSLALMGTSSTILDIPTVVMVPALDTDRYRYQWTTGASLLGALLGMALLRWYRDRFGLRVVYLSGMLIFTLGCAACGAAPDVPWLTPARFVQSFGKGLVVANVLATMWREFPHRKDLAMAFYGIGLYFGKAIAPTVGGFLTDYPDWRWIFYSNMLLGLVTFVLSWWVLLPDKPEDVTPQPFDWPGLGLLVVWVIALMVCLMRGQKWGWTTDETWVVLAALFVVTFTAWLTWEFLSPTPLVDLGLLRARTFTLALTIKSLYVINLYGIITVLAHYMVVLRAYPRTTTGLVLLPGALAMGLMLVVSGLVGMQWNRKRRLLTGLVVMAFASWQLGVLDLYTAKWWIALDFVLWGAGAGLVVSPVICLPQEGLTQAQVVSSASIKNMVRILPGTLGSLVVSIALTRQGDIYQDALRRDVTYNRAVVEDVRLRLADHLAMRGSSGEVVPEQVNRVLGTYVSTDAQAYACGTVAQYLALVCVAGAVLALFLPGYRAETRETGS